MNAILAILKSFLGKGTQLFGLRSVLNSFFGKKEAANNIVRTDGLNKDRFVERFFGTRSASSPSDDAPNVFKPDPLMSAGGGTILPLDTVIPQIDSTPLQDSSLSSIVNQINKINANIDSIRNAMIQSAVIEAGYRKKIIEDFEKRLTDRGGDRSERRNRRRRFNFLRNTAKNFQATRNTIAKNPFLRAVVGGLGMEIIGNMLSNNDKKNNNKNNKNNNQKTASLLNNQNNNVASLPMGFGNRGVNSNLLASAGPLTGLFNNDMSETNLVQDDTIDNSMLDIVDNLSVINELLMPGGSETTNFSSSFKGSNFSSNMSLVASASRSPIPVGSKSGITVLDLRSGSGKEQFDNMGKSVPIFGSDVTSSEPLSGDWEGYLSRGRA